MQNIMMKRRHEIKAMKFIKIKRKLTNSRSQDSSSRIKKTIKIKHERSIPTKF
jgi:hypothetical protein